MNKIYFSKVFKGYNPEEVEAFILKLNSDIQQKQQDFSAESKRLNSEMTELRQRFEETIAENEKLVKENRDLKDEQQSLLNEIKRLSELKVTPTEEPKEKITAQEKPQETVPVKEPEQVKDYDYKKLCEQMGERLLIADMRAEEIIKDAQSEADKIIAKAAESADAEIKRIVAEANERIETFYKAITEYEKKQVYITAGLEQARKHITDAISEVEALKSSD